MQFAMASSIVANRVGLRELTDEFVLRNDVQALIPKVAVAPDDRVDPKRTGNAPYDQVVIEMTDGRRIESARVTDERGSPQLPLSREELWAKFKDCFSVGNPKLEAQPIFDALMSLEHVSGVPAFTGMRKAA
jgi:2-methylcitrate dehydratase PrpD